MSSPPKFLDIVMTLIDNLEMNTFFEYYFNSINMVTFEEMTFVQFAFKLNSHDKLKRALNHFIDHVYSKSASTTLSELHANDVNKEIIIVLALFIQDVIRRHPSVDFKIRELLSDLSEHLDVKATANSQRSILTILKDHLFDSLDDFIVTEELQGCAI